MTRVKLSMGNLIASFKSRAKKVVAKCRANFLGQYENVCQNVRKISSNGGTSNFKKWSFKTLIFSLVTKQKEKYYEAYEANFYHCAV